MKDALISYENHENFKHQKTKYQTNINDRNSKFKNWKNNARHPISDCNVLIIVICNFKIVCNLGIVIWDFSAVSRKKIASIWISWIWLWRYLEKSAFMIDYLSILRLNRMVAFTGSKVQGFKVAFSSLDSIWDAYLRQKRQLRQAWSKIWSQIGIYLGKWAFLTRISDLSFFVLNPLAQTWIYVAQLFRFIFGNLTRAVIWSHKSHSPRRRLEAYATSRLPARRA
jgi:hypothetical protein